MPKPRSYEGLIPLSFLDQRVLEHYGLANNPIARARTRPRALRGVLERRPDLAVWINARLHVLDQSQVLEEVADEVGLLQPPVAVSPSSMDAAA